MIHGILVHTRSLIGCHLVTLEGVEAARQSTLAAIDCIRVAFIADTETHCSAPAWRALTAAEKLLLLERLNPLQEAPLLLTDRLDPVEVPQLLAERFEPVEEAPQL